MGGHESEIAGDAFPATRVLAGSVGEAHCLSGSREVCSPASNGRIFATYDRSHRLSTAGHRHAAEF
jgi:hypothetical protein